MDSCVNSFKKIVFICSPHKSGTGDIAKNNSITKKLCQKVIAEGNVPFAPHLFFTQFLDDNDPIERETGIVCGMEFIHLCDEFLIYIHDGISETMEKEKNLAKDIGKPILEFIGDINDY